MPDSYKLLLSYEAEYEADDAFAAQRIADHIQERQIDTGAKAAVGACVRSLDYRLRRAGADPQSPAVTRSRKATWQRILDPLVDLALLYFGASTLWDGIQGPSEYSFVVGVMVLGMVCVALSARVVEKALRQL